VVGSNVGHLMRIGPPITFADVLAAADRIRGAVAATPTALSHTLSAITGTEVVVKFENLLLDSESSSTVYLAAKGTAPFQKDSA
jgi:hypothetical protein